MSLFDSLIYATINSGSTVSSDITIGNARLSGLWCPTVTSCEMFVQASFNTTSAYYVRVTDPDPDPGAGAADEGHLNDWKWSVGVGSKAIPLHHDFAAFKHFRLESSVAQTDTRTLVVHVKQQAH